MTEGGDNADPARPPIERAGTAAEFTAVAKQMLANERSTLTDSLAKGVAIETLIGRYRECLDVLVSKAWSLSLGDTGVLALVATGGYGRGELYPHSDIDLLVCGDEAEHARHADAIGRFFSMLWDSGLKVGQAVRSISHCLEQSRLDVATYTALLEIRLLVGNPEVFRELEAAVNSPEVYEARGISRLNAMNSVNAMQNSTILPITSNRI